MENSRKRQRANSNGDAVPSQTAAHSGIPQPLHQFIPQPHHQFIPQPLHQFIPQPLEVPIYSLSECIEKLDIMDDGKTIRGVLFGAALRDSTTAWELRKLYHEHIQREQSKVIDFDPDSKSVWSAINRRYSGMSGSRQYDMAFEVLESVTSTIRSIGDEASAQYTSYGTKRSALETLRKIGKTICLSGDVIGHEVRKQFGAETALEDAMNAVIAKMSEEECEKMCAIHDGRSTFLQKMEELHQLAEDYCIFADLGGVLDALAGEINEAEDENENEEEEGDEDEEDEEDDEEHEHESPVSDVPRHNIYGRGLEFDNSEEEMEWMECYDSCGAPKNDAKSRWVLAKYERKRARRG